MLQIITKNAGLIIILMAIAVLVGGLVIALISAYINDNKKP